MFRRAGGSDGGDGGVGSTVAAWPFAGRHPEVDLFRRALDDASCSGFTIRGASGTGKTALAGQCLELVQKRGLPYVRIDATETSAAVPLAAIAHLLPVELLTATPIVLFAAMQDRLRARLEAAQADRMVVFVDDVGLLDATSLALISSVLASPSLFLLTTSRSDRPDPELVEALWRSGRAVGLELNALDRGQLDLLLHMVLKAPVSAAASAGLWQASGGNPLFLRELVHDALWHGVLDEIEGVWQLTGQLTVGPRLVDFVQTRIGDLEPEAREVLNRLALCGPVPLSRLTADVGDAWLDDLERRGLVSVHSNGSVLQADVAHPVHRQALRALLPVSRRTRYLLDEAERVESAGALTDADLTRLASWRLEAGIPLTDSLLLRAVRLARFAYDFDTVERLTLSLPPSSSDLELLCLRAEALYFLNRHDEADQLGSAALAGSAPDDPQRGHLVAVVMATRFSGLGRLAAAVALADDEVARGTAAAHEAQALAAYVLALAGQPSRARAFGWHGGGARGEVYAGILEALVAVADGQTDAALAAVDSAERQLRSLGTDAVGLPHPLVLENMRMAALVRGGRWDRAETLALKAIDGAALGQSQVAAARLTAYLAFLQLWRGQPQAALAMAREAVSSGRHDGIGHGKLLGLAASVQALVMMRQQSEAGQAMDELVGLPDDGGCYAEVELARAWLQAGAGELGQARKTLLAAAHRCIDQEDPSQAMALLAEAVRFGAKGLAAELAGLGSGMEGPLAAAQVQMAAALDAADPEAMAGAAASFAGLGLPVHEAECLSFAAGLARAAGQTRRGQALETRASTLTSRFGDVWTPGLVTVPAQVPLTAREHEIAVMAVAGHSSQAIAAALVVSVRTVSNHLQNIYSKTGAGGRSELAALIHQSGPQPSSRG